MFNQKLLSTLFIILTFTSFSKCMSGESDDALLDAHTSISSQLNYPMNSLGEDFFGNLLSTDVFENNLDNFNGMISSDGISFTFAADYSFEEASKRDGTVPAFVRVIFEPAMQKKDIKSTFRYKHGLDMASITCNPLMDMKNGKFYKVAFNDIENPMNSDLIGLYTEHGVPYRRFMQKFYEQTHHMMNFSDGEKQIGSMVTIQVMEAFEGNLTTPLNQIIESPTTEDKFNVMMRILETGDNLWGNRTIHGDIRLENFGYHVVQDSNGKNQILPVLKFSDKLVNVLENFNNETDLQDRVLRNVKYPAPWSTELTDSNQNPFYVYTFNNKEEAYSYLQLINDFAILNGLDKSLIYKQFIKKLNKHYNLSATSPDAMTDLEQIFLTVQQFYKDFIKANQKIFI